MESCWRVSVVRGTRIAEQRVVPWGAPVVLSDDARITMEDGRPVLRLPSGVAAEIATHDRPRVSVSGSAVLDAHTRGYVDLPTGRVIFQSTNKPAAPPKLARPHAVRTGALSGIDWPFMAMLGGSLLLGVAGIARVARHHPVSLDGWDAPEPIVSARPVLHIPKPLPVKPPVEVADPRMPAAPNARPARPGGGPSPAQRERDVREAVRRMGLLPALGSNAGGAVGRVFGSAVDPSLIDGLDDVRNVPTPTLVDSRTRTIGSPGPGSQDVDVKGPATIDTVVVPEHMTECPDGTIVRGVARCSGPVTFHPPEPVPGVPQDVLAQITREVKGRIGAVQSCYERTLKLHGRQNGRIDLRFTVTTEGAVLDPEAEATRFAAGGDEIATCVTNRARTWKFKARPPEDIPVQFPFVLSAP